VHAGYASAASICFAGRPALRAQASAGEGRAAEKGRHGVELGGGPARETFAVDASRIFVGSFNFDLRSALINTEMGPRISEPGAGRSARRFLREGRAAFRVRGPAAGRRRAGMDRTDRASEKRHETEPGAGWFRRFAVGVLSTLPIDWML